MKRRCWLGAGSVSWDLGGGGLGIVSVSGEGIAVRYTLRSFEAACRGALWVWTPPACPDTALHGVGILTV